MLTAQDLKDITELDNLQLETLALDFFYNNTLCFRAICYVQLIGLEGNHLVLLTHYVTANGLSVITIHVDVKKALLLQRIKRHIQKLIKLPKPGHNMLKIGYNKT